MTDGPQIRPPRRDAAAGLVAEGDDPPPIVSVSDVHGYLDEGRSALTTPNDHPDYDPVVEPDENGRLNWAGNDYVLVINGDLVDRGPANEETVAMARRLARQAPPGRVRVTVGNHEMALLLPEVLHWPRWYSGRVDLPTRRRFYDDVASGLLVAAYEGHDHVYAHAGRPEPYDVERVNDRLQSAAERLERFATTRRFGDEQRSVAEEYDDIFGTGGRTGRGPGAGICWLDFEHMPGDAPPQVVGHTRHREPTRKGNVVCQNVIRDNRSSPGGEATLVERPGELVALVRDRDGDVRDVDLSAK